MSRCYLHFKQLSYKEKFVSSTPFNLRNPSENHCVVNIKVYLLRKPMQFLMFSINLRTIVRYQTQLNFCTYLFLYIILSYRYSFFAYLNIKQLSGSILIDLGLTLFSTFSSKVLIYVYIF